MTVIDQIFGIGKDLTLWQMCARAFVMFFISLLLIRLGGVRMFGRKSAFDDIIVITLGAVLSRGVVGASSFGATVAASAVLVAVHRTLAWLCYKSKRVEEWVRGKPSVIYKNRKMYVQNLKKAGLTEIDLMESLRLEMKKESLEEIESAYIETNGRISFIAKPDK